MKIENESHISPHTHIAQQSSYEANIIPWLSGMRVNNVHQMERYNFVLCFFVFFEEHQQKEAFCGITGRACHVAPSS